MKLFTAEQIREIDQFTINNEPLRSIDLMERAAGALFDWFSGNIKSDRPIMIFAGPGNNGGDSLALARMLSRDAYNVSVCILDITPNTSSDWKTNMKRLSDEKVDVIRISSLSEVPKINPDTVIIDAIFGTGLDRKVEGMIAGVIKHINKVEAKVVALDIPSGLFAEDNTANNLDAVVKADITLTLQFPKISFMLADTYSFVGTPIVLPIGLHPGKIEQTKTGYNILEPALISKILKTLSKFDHKGNNGHALLVAGSCGKVGAAVLSARAALRTGLGLLTVHVPRPAADIIHISVPEAMVQCDQSDVLISEVYDIQKYSAIGLGPGIGTKPNTVKALKKLLEDYKGPLVLDADALNILSLNKNLLSELTPDTILTPHPGEFDRLAGKSASSFERLSKQGRLAKLSGSVIVLKGANTSIALPDGSIWFNPSGNPGMATAGSGDVLTGIIMALLAKGYTIKEAAFLGVYLHGQAGDIAVENSAPESLIASDIINNIGNSYLKIRKG